MFKEYNRHQDFLLPASASDFIEPGDLVNIIAEIVDSFDITPFRSRYEPLGPNAYNPHMMLGLLFYAYSQGVFSSRKIAERVRYDLRFMFIAGYQHPDFRTISDFRKNNIDLLQGYFKQIVLLCRKLGLLALRTIAIDGTKIKANASTDRVKDRDELSRQMDAVEDEIARMLSLAQVTDDNEDESLDSDSDQHSRIKDLQDLRDKLRKAQTILDDNPRRNNVNLTDPDCRIMKSVGSGYNAQLAVDEKNGIIVATDVVDDVNDLHQLMPMIDEVESVTESKGEPKTVLADAGYATAKAYTELESHPYVRAYVPSKEDTQHQRKEPPPFDKSRFTLDAETGTGMCPLGQPMRFLRKAKNMSGQHYLHFVGTACPKCARRSECTKVKYRNVSMLCASPVIEQMNKRMQTPMGRQAMAIRKRTVEPVIGILKEQLGFRQFRLRGIKKVKGEFALLCSAFNLKKIHQLLGGLSVNQAMLVMETEFEAIITPIWRFLCPLELLRIQFRFQKV